MMPPLKRNEKHTKIKGKRSSSTNKPQSTNQNTTITSLFRKQNTSVKCPCCARIIPKDDINIHLDVCCITSDVVEITIDSDSEIKVENVMNEAKLSPQKRKSSSSVEESPKRAKISDEKEDDVVAFRQKRPYYLDNFILVVNAVIKDPDDSCLFDREDKNVLDEFFKLSVDAQKLYVRMFQRKLKWYQVMKLDYQEIKDDLNEIVDEIIGNKFFVNGHDSIDLCSILHLMQLNDLKLLLKKLNLTQWLNSNKTIIIDNVLKHGKQQKTLFVKSMDQVILKEATKIFGKCFKLDNRVRRIFVRVFLLFSLTSYIPNDDHKQQQQVFTLHLVNTNQLTFPDYSVLRSAHVFRSRDDLIRYERMYEIELDLMSAIERGNWERAFEIYTSCKELVSALAMENDDLHAHVLTLPSFLQRYSAGATLIRCLSFGVDILERLRKYEAAVDQLEKLIAQTDYHLDYRGRWSERLSLNLEQHLKQPKKALDTIVQALNDPRIRGGHKLALTQRAIRICSSAKNAKLKSKLNKIPKFDVREIPKIVIEGRIVPSSSTSGCKTTFMTPIGDSDDMLMSSVEDFAINHYKNVGFDQGVHGESSTFTSLFCLLFWDVMYMSGIPDVFRSPHQIAPLDLNGECFYRQRKGDIDEKLEWLRNANSAQISDQLATCWAMHFGMTSLVNWGLFSSFQHLESLSECIEGAILSSICERLAKDYRFTRSGFPDLVVWSTREKKFKVVEVKGPNDRLSTKQTLWLDFLLNIGVSAEVCHVSASGSKKLKKLDKTS